MKFVSFVAAAVTLIGAVPAFAQANPTAAETQAARSRGPCGDPWVTIALETVYGRVPDRLHCSISLYNGGRWSSYAELLGAVRAGRYSFRPVRIDGNGPLAGRFALGIFQGGSLVAAGGGNMVAAGGGNMVAAGGGNMVAAGGGNVILQNGNALVSPTPGAYGLSGGTPVRVIN
ncbi:hypothetical protein [Sphingomonas sp.]|uniref:hypothetical protein n=1 Tax=Sphingomonas sp. TaxID=28214 RepID=UPI001EB4C8E6|nr:hypothetical protein [Sphingomonas sp.]MBX3592924.1 hypothetical protein [Sphingomonas sp.]